MLKTLAAAFLFVGPAAQTITIVDTGKTMAGQPLTVPAGPLQVVATRSVLPAGAKIPTHMHFWAATSMWRAARCSSSWPGRARPAPTSRAR